jgi:branched-chain amino acid transport system permease protein
MLEVAHLGKRFGGVAALEDVTIAFAPGEVTGLVGPNGSGKTTLFNVITGLLRASVGAVTLDGVDIGAERPQRIARRGIGRSFQHTRIVQNLSVRDNIVLALPQVTDGVLAMMALRRRGLRALYDLADGHLAMVGLEAVADRPASRLSYGEQRVAMIACLLASGARILLLDEPTGGIDPAARGRVLDLVIKLRGLGRTVVLIEHNLDVIRGAADRVVFMAEGRVLASGTAAEIEADPALARLYFGTAPLA